MKFQLQISNKVSITPMACLFELEIPKNSINKFHFVPGQYIQVYAKSEDGIELNRCYSICSKPNSNVLSICIKRVPGGVFSNLLCDSFEIGKFIDVSLPLGNFTLENSEAYSSKNIVFITAGSGITPIISMLETLLESKYKGGIYLIYGNVNEENIIFRERIAELSGHSTLNIYNIVESGNDNYTIGKLTEEFFDHFFLNEKLPLNSSLFYLSGPPVVIQNAQNCLHKNGISKNKINTEKFFIETENILNKDTHSIRIKSDKREKKILVKPGQSILDASLEAGIPVEHSCRTGDCRSCIARLKSGSIISNISSNSYKQKILTCQSYPNEDDVLVDYDKSLFESIVYNRDNLLFIGFIVSTLLFLLVLHPNNEFILAKGPFNTGHEGLSCVDCHKPADGSIRQQLQANSKYFLNFHEEAVDFGNKSVENEDCINCHDRPNDRHPVHRFKEPRFASARKEIHPENCISCHAEHNAQRVTLDNIGFCVNCHRDIDIKNDPLDVKHNILISNDNWETCLQCHDFHGNHIMETASIMKDTFSVNQIKNYFDGGNSPYGNEKEYTANSKGVKQ